MVRLSFLVCFALCSTLTAPSQAISWSDLVPALRNQIQALWQTNELQFLDYTCFYYQKPRIRSWELYYQGTFFCPTWTKIKGTGLTRSQSGVMTKTIEDFLKKVRAAGLVDEEEASLWLEGFSGP